MTIRGSGFYFDGSAPAVPARRESLEGTSIPNKKRSATMDHDLDALAPA